MHLNQAEGTFDLQRAVWVVQMDCFNQIILHAVFNKKLRMRIAYENVFSSLNSRRLQSTFPNMSKSFEYCHKQRSSSFIAHAYSKEKDRFATDLRVWDRNKLRKKLKSAYQELVDNL